jgi:hypothetical protein
LTLALFLSNTAEERVEALDIIPDSLGILPAAKGHRGFDLISNALPFGRLWYGEPNAVSNAVDYAKFRSRSHDAVIRVYDAAGLGLSTQSNDKLI